MEFGKSFISGLGSAGASSLTGLITGLETWENINESVDLIVDGLVEVFKALKGGGQIEINTTTVSESPKGRTTSQSKTTKKSK